MMMYDVLVSSTTRCICQFVVSNWNFHSVVWYSPFWVNIHHQKMYLSAQSSADEVRQIFQFLRTSLVSFEIPFWSLRFSLLNKKNHPCFITSWHRPKETFNSEIFFSNESIWRDASDDLDSVQARFSSNIFRGSVEEMSQILTLLSKEPEKTNCPFCAILTQVT